jgi:hypothetical protein
MNLIAAVTSGGQHVTLHENGMASRERYLLTFTDYSDDLPTTTVVACDTEIEGLRSLAVWLCCEEPWAQLLPTHKSLRVKLGDRAADIFLGV